MKKMFLAISLLFSLTITSANAVEVTVEAKITGLYVAFFNRAADQEGLIYWTTTADNVAKQGGDVSSVFRTIAKGFATHLTFKSTYGDLNNKEFVEAIYRNALGRDGDAQGIAYWTDLIDRGMIRSDMVATFVKLSMVTDLTLANYPSLSTDELAAAQLRQDLITNKVTVAVAFTKQLEELSNVEDNQNPENDPAYLASIKIISAVNEDMKTVSDILAFLEGIINTDDQIGDILEAKYLASDTTKPVITLEGESIITLIVGDAYMEARATTTDDRDGNIAITITGSVDTSTVGTYTITYSATDSAGNSAIKIRTVNVNAQECIQVITHAYNPETGEERDFPTPCDVLEGWIVGSTPVTVETLELTYDYITYWKQIASDLDEQTYSTADYLYSSVPDIDNCDMGALSEDAKQRVLLVSNYTRELHGLSPLNYNYGFDDEVQASSLIMKANNTMTHHPSSSSLCYTQEGYTGSSTSNISSGYGIVDPVKHVIGWIDDSRNISTLSAVAHRRWALNPFGEYLTYGQNEGFSALKVFGFDQTYNTDIDIDYVAFPYKRYPYLFLSNNSAYPTPWSFSIVEQKDIYYNNSFDYFNNSTVTVREKTSGILLDITNQYYDKATYGLANILTWQVSDWKYDTLYEVNIANVTMQNGEVKNFTYEVFIDYKEIITIRRINEDTDTLENNHISGNLYNNLDEDSFVVNLSGAKTFTGDNSIYSNMAFYINLYDSNKQLIKASDESFAMSDLNGNYTVVISHKSKETGEYYASDNTDYTVEID